MPSLWSPSSVPISVTSDPPVRLGDVDDAVDGHAWLVSLDGCYRGAFCFVQLSHWWMIVINSDRNSVCWPMSVIACASRCPLGNPCDRQYKAREKPLPIFPRHRQICQRAERVKAASKRGSLARRNFLRPYAARVRTANMEPSAVGLGARKRMWSGDHPGLQNRRSSSFGGDGGFDSHSLPPLRVGLARVFHISLLTLG